MMVGSLGGDALVGRWMFVVDGRKGALSGVKGLVGEKVVYAADLGSYAWLMRWCLCHGNHSAGWNVSGLSIFLLEDK